jgi:hypothetical protein
VLFSSAGADLLHRAFGMTPNIAPPSTLKFEILKRDNFIYASLSRCKIANFGIFAGRNP